MTIAQLRYTKCTIVNIILHLGIDALTFTSPPELNVSLGSDSTIVLNCSFEKEINEQVFQIIWSKKNVTEDKYKQIVQYYANGYLYKDLDMKDRSTSVTFNRSPSVILNISEVRCKDNGQYKCHVEHEDSSGIEISTFTTVNIQGKKVSLYYIL